MVKWNPIHHQYLYHINGDEENSHWLVECSYLSDESLMVAGRISGNHSPLSSNNVSMVAGK